MWRELEDSYQSKLALGKPVMGWQRALEPVDIWSVVLHFTATCLWLPKVPWGWITPLSWIKVPMASGPLIRMRTEDKSDWWVLLDRTINGANVVYHGYPSFS